MKTHTCVSCLRREAGPKLLVLKESARLWGKARRSVTVVAKYLRRIGDLRTKLQDHGIAAQIGDINLPISACMRELSLARRG